MGLDIYFHGRITPRGDHPVYTSTGEKIAEIRVELGYLRNDHALSDYICAVLGAGNGVETHLGADDLHSLIAAINEGMIKGEDGSVYDGTLVTGYGSENVIVTTLQPAIDWIFSGNPDKEYRDVVYYASW